MNSWTEISLQETCTDAPDQNCAV